MKLKRDIVISPAYDKRSSIPGKNYGIHNAEIRFLLTGPKGVVQFVASTGWDLPHVAQELEANHKYKSKAWGTDLGYHSRKPRYEGQLAMGDCPYLGGKPCYYDGSTLNAELVFNLMVSEGHEAVWKRLEDYYNELFINPR